MRSHVRIALLTVAILGGLGAAGAAYAAEPLPADTGMHGMYAQHLVDETLAAHPEVLVLAVHAKPPRSTDIVIVASNMGRIGKKSDEDDLRVIATGQPKLEVDKAGDRFEIEETLKDVSGETIGALGIVYPYTKGQDTSAYQRTAAQIQTFFGKHVLSEANLMDPYPYSTEYVPGNAAQTLVDRTMARHPELIVVGMHVTLSGERGNVMLASNIGRVGKKADVDDMRVVTTGKPNFEVAENGKRYEVELVLEDASGKNVGALGLVFRYTAGDDKAALNAVAEAIRNEMARDIPTADALLVKAPLAIGR